MKRALVTGASRGIGRAVAEMLLGEGWAVDGISRTAPDIRHDNFCWWAHDISDPDRTRRPSVWASTGLRFGFQFDTGEPLDALIHCAGIRGPRGPLGENDATDWVETIHTNLLGAYYVVRAALPLLRQSEDGRVLLMSGGGAFNPSPGFSAYATAKGGVVSLMETLAVEERGRVSVNCVAPGPVPTTIHDVPLLNDGGAGMAMAVACVRRLLSPQAKGLTGKTVSAVWDDWGSLTPWTVERLNDSPAGTRTRVPIAMLAQQRMRAV